MHNSKQLGRSSPRNYTGSAFPDGYLDIESLEELESLEARLRAVLTQRGAQAIVYDKEATAFVDNGSTVTPRTEPVMLHRWKGDCHGETPTYTDRRRGFDTVGLKIIVRGRGLIQAAITKVMNNTKPDKGSTKKYKTYTFACKHIGIEDWQ